MSNRTESIDILTRMSTNHFYGHREQEAFKLAVEALSVQPERRGKKKVYYHGENNFSYVCDQCGMPIDGNDVFCRWCGTKMEV